MCIDLKPGYNPVHQFVTPTVKLEEELTAWQVLVSLQWFDFVHLLMVLNIMSALIISKNPQWNPTQANILDITKHSCLFSHLKQWAQQTCFLMMSLSLPCIPYNVWFQQCWRPYLEDWASPETCFLAFFSCQATGNVDQHRSACQWHLMLCAKNKHLNFIYQACQKVLKYN